MFNIYSCSVVFVHLNEAFLIHGNVLSHLYMTKSQPVCPNVASREEGCEQVFRILSWLSAFPLKRKSHKHTKRQQCEHAN